MYLLGLRRSEVCAATTNDLEGKRKIFLPDSLVKEIKEADKIFDKQPHNLARVLHQKQDELKIPRFRFHDLRHFYASYAHEHGMSDADIMASGGWQSDYTMKLIYRHAMEKEKQDMQKQIASGIL